MRWVIYAWHRYSRARPDSYVWELYRDDDVVKIDGVWKFRKRVFALQIALPEGVASTKPCV